MDERLKTVIRPQIQSMRAYAVAPSDGMIKLDAMENPYELPDQVKQAWLAGLAELPLNRYPTGSHEGLGESIARCMGIDGDYRILLGNGSDEIIHMLCACVDGPVLVPSPTFVMYEVLAGLNRIPFMSVPLTADWQLDEDAMLRAIESRRPALVFISYPNNPTGNLFEEAPLRRIIEACPGLVVIDEAYYVFSHRQALPWLHDYEHLLIMRTFSKVGLAAIRLGLLIGRARWIEQIDKARLPYNINLLTQATAEFLLNHWSMFTQQAGEIVEQRQMLYGQLQKLPAVVCFPSEANFILFKVKGREAATVFEALKARGVLIKLMPQQGELKQCLRVTVGTAAQNRAFMEAITPLLLG